MRILLIFNPRAGRGRGRKKLALLEDRFRSGGCDAELRLTEFQGHGISLLEEADLSSYDGVVATGGDGTVHEVVTGYYRNPSGAKPPMGIIPNGTGNAFVREMGLLGSDWEKAVEAILRNETRKVDVARFTSGGETFYSLNILGVGFVSDVSETATHLKFLGNNAYLMAVFYRLLDLVILKRISRWRVIQIFRTIFSGEHVLETEVEYRQARMITIQTPIPRVLNVDGEIKGTTPIEVECLPGDLEVFW